MARKSFEDNLKYKKGWKGRRWYPSLKFEEGAQKAIYYGGGKEEGEGKEMMGDRA